MKWILRYLHGIIDIRLCFGGDEFTLVGYLDSDMAGDIDSRKSTLGYLIKFVEGCDLAVQAAKVCSFVYYRGRIHCHYRSMQRVAMGEEILAR